MRCAWCLKEIPIIIEHHYPVPKCEGGQETVGICGNCHLLCHTGMLLIDCTKAMSNKQCSDMYWEALEKTMTQDFPGLKWQDAFPIPYNKVYVFNPPWKIGLSPEKEEALLTALESARQMMEY